MNIVIEVLIDISILHISDRISPFAAAKIRTTDAPNQDIGSTRLNFTKVLNKL